MPPIRDCCRFQRELFGVVEELEAVGGVEAFHFLGLEQVGIDGGVDHALSIACNLIDLIDGG